MTGLAPRARVYYHVGTNDSWSPEYSFISNAVGGDQFPYVLGHFADVGESSNAAKTVTKMLSPLAGAYDAVLLTGDMSYASGCEKTGCTTWDAFQRMIEPVSATVPISVELGSEYSAPPARSPENRTLTPRRVREPNGAPPPPSFPSNADHEYDDNNAGVKGFSARKRFSGMPYPAGSKDNLDYFSCGTPFRIPVMGSATL